MKSSLRKRMKRVLTILVLLVLTMTTVLTPSSVEAYGPSTMYNPQNIPGTEAPGCLYSRAIQTANGNMYCTFEERKPGVTVFPVYESVNGGQNWNWVGNVNDTHHGVGLRWNPNLYEMPQTIGSLTAGTLLCAGLVVPNTYDWTAIDLYKSTDKGRSWTFVSHIASGGVPNADGTQDPIWEPQLLVANNKLICYYTDERDPAHNQKIVHQTTTDGVNWSSVVDDVALNNSTLRPGMPVLAKMANGSYIMTYEIVGLGTSNYQTSSNPEVWNVTSTGTQFGGQGSPYCVNLNGTIILSCEATDNLYVNTNNAVGGFDQISSPLATGYSRSLVPLKNGRLFLTQAGHFGEDWHTVQYADMAINYKFTNVTDGKAVDTYNYTTSGSDITQYTSGWSVNQKWNFIDLGNGYFQIQSVANGLCIDSMGRTGNGSICGMYAKGTSINQQWSIIRGNGYIKIKNRANGLCLDTGGVTTDGASLQMWADGSSTNQRWVQTAVN